ncbi:hypothetical protein NLJ89_g11084 [Agrocybe chaxingu]|uniref:Uncharacterized protein n=1 Tax=Agrocybe chaxingu TaxID=84603 RepID=A0A9W8JQL1_9AGAR|nr:hypothetical protein NLJ89_g11084 [Agrocybe chaxingu]
MHPTRELAKSALFQIRHETLPKEQQIALSYSRAKAIVQAYGEDVALKGITAKDLLKFSPKFWQLHTDPISTMDGAAATLCTIQLNLCAGTLARVSIQHPSPEVIDTLNKVLTFEYCGQFCLTEVGHGLDAIHLETTATLLEDGTFELHSPTEKAAKFVLIFYRSTVD